MTTEDTIEIGRREAAALRASIAQRANPQRILIRQAGRAGAGVMGAQIAAHLANANVKPILSTCPARAGTRAPSRRRRSTGWRS
jgi:hypothetical protein